MARKILLADDSVTAQNMGRKILADAGYDVATVNNGSAALKRVAELKPDLIVLDVYMPGYSGLEVCQRLKDSDDTAHIPVLLSVGKLEPFKPEEARRVGADAHIVKPFEASELLTAITRLEDLLATQAGNGVRGNGADPDLDKLRSAGNGKKSESSSPADTGWKSRLGFSSKKKKEEPAEAADTETGTFRDFRKGKRNGVGEAKKATPTPAPAARTGSDLPRDITPDELDALSALAAKLDGSSLRAEKGAPVANETAGAKPLASPEVLAVASASTLVSETAVAEAAVAEAPGSAEPVAEAKASEPRVAEPQFAVPQFAVPVAEAAISEFAIVEAPVFAVEGKSEVEIPIEHVELPIETVSAAAAVVDPDPGPVETEQPAISAPAATEYSEEHSEGHSEQYSKIHSEHYSKSEPENGLSETPVVFAATVNAAQFMQEPACVDREDEPGFATAPSALESSIDEQATQVQAIEEPGPSDAELVQALQLLTPANWNADACPAQESLAAGKTASSEESVETGPRWMAEPVALNPEEAAISLEAEMFRTFAAQPTTATGKAYEAAGITGVSAIEAIVENTLAAAEMTARAEALPESLPVSLPVSLTESAGTEEDERLSSEQSLAEQDSAHRDFAYHDSAHHDSARPGAETTAPEISAAEQSVLQNETPSVSPAATADAGHVHPEDTSKPVQLVADEPPKAKAAAAAAAEGGESTSATDASTIASIVDRVMADLRPKIVEEITRKLAGKSNS